MGCARWGGLRKWIHGCWIVSVGFRDDSDPGLFVNGCLGTVMRMVLYLPINRDRIRYSIFWGYM